MLDFSLAPRFLNLAIYYFRNAEAPWLPRFSASTLSGVKVWRLFRFKAATHQVRVASALERVLVSAFKILKALWL